MRRNLVTAIIAVLALAVGLAAGVGLQRAQLPVVAAASAAPPDPYPPLTPFQRGQLLTQCYQAQATALRGTAGYFPVSAYVTLKKECVDAVWGLK